MTDITPDIIAEVRRRAILYEVISERVILKRAGKEYKGLCPFHKEKSPSFHVNSEKGIYKCFGCGEGGDVFAFVQKAKGFDFRDAVRELAQRYGIQLIQSFEQKEQYDKRSAMLMLYQQAAEYYAHLLTDPLAGQVARDYLYGRGITDDTIKKFKLGYAANSWDGLLRYLTADTLTAKVSPRFIEEAGLARRKQDSTSYFDLFRHRLMVPVFDDQGRVIAFGGRTLGDDQVKYINSPESPIYTKGQHLYAFHLAKEAIKEKDSVIVVEGYFDVITSHQFGFTNTVATCGTALTETQARALVRYSESKRVYLAFDADDAGVRAVDRGAATLNEISEGIGLDLRVLAIPGGKDPDECLRSVAAGERSGSDLYQEAIDKALPLIDYQLQKVSEGLNLVSHTGRIDAAKRLVPVFAEIKNAVARGEYIRQWSMKLGIREEELLADVRQHLQANRYQRQNQPASNLGSGSLGQAARALAPHLASTRGGLKHGYIEAEQQLLALYLTSRTDNERVHDALLYDAFLSPVHARIKEHVEGIGTQFNTIEDLRARLMDRLSPDPEALAAFVEIILKVDELKKQNSPVEILLKEFRRTLLKERLSRATIQIRSRFNSAQEEAEKEALQSKIIQLNSIKQDLDRAESNEILDDLKRKIDDITGAEQPPPDNELQQPGKTTEAEGNTTEAELNSITMYQAGDELTTKITPDAGDH